MTIINKINATVESIIKQSSDTISLLLMPEKPVLFSAGQFLMVNIPYKNTFVRRAYSIASPPWEKGIEICLNYIPEGLASRFLFNIRSGESIQIDGPYGIFGVKDTKKTKFFIATGTGVAPIRSMIHHLFYNKTKCNIYLIYGERTEADILYRKEFEQLSAKHKNFCYIPTLSRPENCWRGERGYVQQVMKKYINGPAQSEVYICGLKEMVDDVKKELVSTGWDINSIFTERFV